MRTLSQTLQDKDIGHLRIVAELWDVDLPPGGGARAADKLAEEMSRAERLHDMVEVLPEEARRALSALVHQGGRMPWPDFARRFGGVRPFGPGRRDREKIWRKPASVGEMLWFRGLIDRGFNDTQLGPIEFAFIPVDLMANMPEAKAGGEGSLGHAAPPPVHALPASSKAVDDATTLLAALRRRPAASGRLDEAFRQRLATYMLQPASSELLVNLLLDIGLLRPKPLEPDPELVGAFLEDDRAAALQRLGTAWIEAESWNDLARVDHLRPATGEWPNDPKPARRALLEFLSDLDSGVWWDLESFTQAVRERSPGFQRPGGDFDSWYLRHTRTGAFLRGFQHWDLIEGALLRQILHGPLHWLGAVDLGFGPRRESPDRFRLTPWFGVLLHPDETRPVAEPRAHSRLTPDGRIVVPRSASRTLRYQVSRFCRWLNLQDDQYVYAITPSALRVAHRQGLQLQHVLALLEAAASHAPPTILLEAVQRYWQAETPARITRRLVLQVSDASVLDSLLSDASTQRHIAERYGPTVAELAAHDVQPLLRAASLKGLLIEPPVEGDDEAWP